MSAVPAPSGVARRSRGVPPWLSFAARRSLRLVTSVWVLITFAFLIIHLTPGDPIRAALGPRTPPDVIAARRAELGLDDPLPLQYFHYVWNLIHGDLGSSFQSRLPVAQIIGDRLPATLLLAFAAFAVVIAVAIPIGILTAIRTEGGQHRGAEVTFTSAATVLGTIPDFLLAVTAIAVFGVAFTWLPVAGAVGFSSYLIPVLALAVGPAAGLARIVRVEMLSVLQTDYVRTARAKRLKSSRIYLRHALPNALTATLTVSGLLLAGLVAGTVLVEQVVAWPGLGSSLTGSIINKDFPLAQGIVLIYGAIVLIVNLIVDIALVFLDPRSTLKEG